MRERGTAIAASMVMDDLRDMAFFDGMTLTLCCHPFERELASWDELAN